MCYTILVKIGLLQPKVQNNVDWWHEEINQENFKTEESSVQSFLNDFSKDGLKSFLMSASKEVVLEVLNLLPFGGVAKTAFDFLLKSIEGI